MISMRAHSIRDDTYDWSAGELCSVVSFLSPESALDIGLSIYAIRQYKEEYTCITLRPSAIDTHLRARASRGTPTGTRGSHS
jgi:hypothetical protein